MGISRGRRGRAWGPLRVSKENPRKLLQDAQVGRGAEEGRQAASPRMQETIVTAPVGSNAWARAKGG